MFLAASAAAAYFVGAFDEVEFEEQTRLTRNSTGTLQFMAIMATSTNKNISGLMDTLSKASKEGIMAMPNGELMMQQAAKIYGTPEGCNGCQVAIYIDDPQSTKEPRWAVGWAIAANTFREMNTLIDNVQEASGLDRKTTPIRAVRLEGPRSLKATVPFRNKLTPTIGAFLHWKAGFEKYMALDCQADCGRKSEEDGSVAVEIFVTKSPGETIAWIDYILMYGNTATLWDDAFPEIVQLGDDSAGEVAEEDSSSS